MRNGWLPWRLNEREFWSWTCARGKWEASRRLRPNNPTPRNGNQTEVPEKKEEKVQLILIIIILSKCSQSFELYNV